MADNGPAETGAQEPLRPAPGPSKVSPAQQYLLDILSAEMKLIAQAITERNREAIQIKQWCMTLWMASWGVVTIDYFKNWMEGWKGIVLLAPAFFPLFFFVLSMKNKRIERKFTFRARQIYHFMNAAGPGPSPLQDYLETGEIGDFRVYDPGAANWLREEDPSDDKARAEYLEWIGFGSVYRGAWGLRWFYLVLLLVTLIAAGYLWIVQGR